MTEYTDTPQGGADDAPASEAVETTSEATTEQDTGTEDAGLADDAGEATEKPKQVPWFQKRIDEVTAKRYEAEREAAYWRAKAEVTTPQPKPEPTALPTLEQFDYDEGKFAAALIEHTRKETEQSLDRKLTEREQRAAEESKNTTALSKLKEGGAKHSDFIAAVSGIPATEAVRDFILSADNAADVLYELGKDSEASARFHSLTPVQQAIELGRRAGTATPTKATARTIAPPPPTTVAGLSAGFNKPADQMTMAEYAEARKAGKV